MSGFYVRNLPEERYDQLREQAERDMRDLRDEAAVLISEALDARRGKDRTAHRSERRLVAASESADPRSADGRASEFLHGNALALPRLRQTGLFFDGRGPVQCNKTSSRSWMR